MPEKESLVSTIFGSVTEDRVIYFRNKGWFRGGSREDIPIRHITSIESGVSRSIVKGIFLILVWLFLFAAIAESSILIVFVISLLVLIPGVFALWGSPTVSINTSGRDKSIVKGFPWQRGEAEKFVEIARKQIFEQTEE